MQLLLLAVICYVVVYATNYIIRIVFRWVLRRYGDKHGLQDKDKQLLIDTINRLPIEDARQQVECLLQDPERFTVDRTIARHSDKVAHLPNHVRALFQQFDAISTADGQFSAGPAYLHEYSDGDIIEIGGSEDEAIFVRRGDDAIHGGASSDLRNLTPIGPTVYHWLIIADLYSSRL